MIKVITVLTMLLQFCVAGRVSDVQLYARSGEVYAVNEIADTVTVEDSTGNLWDFYGSEDWESGRH